METTNKLSPEMSKFIAIVILILLAFALINKMRKKHGKEPLRIGSLFKKKNNTAHIESTPARNDHWYGNYKKLITVDAFKKISGRSYVVFDLETTGLDADHDRIIEIGAVRVAGGKILDQTFQRLIDPQCKIPPEASAINHITDDMVKGQPSLEKVLPEFLRFVSDDILVAHNGGFDASFIDNACERYRLDAPKKYFDTMRLSVYWDGLKNRKLATFLQAAGIQNDGAHRSLSDAIATAELCIKSMEKIK